MIPAKSLENCCYSYIDILSCYNLVDVHRGNQVFQRLLLVHPRLSFLKKTTQVTDSSNPRLHKILVCSMIKATCSLILAFDHLKDPWSKPLGIPEHHQKVTVNMTAGSLHLHANLCHQVFIMGVDINERNRKHLHF